MNHHTNGQFVRRSLALLLITVLMIVGLGATPASADKSEEFTNSNTFTFVNPCTGLETDITIDAVSE